MNQDQVKDLLKTLAPEAPDFEVLFTGKSSKRKNGFYHPTESRITLNNKNFTSDQELIYTAVHELAHHLHQNSDNPPGPHSHHNLVFKVIFRELLAKAIEAGAYRLEPDAELQKAIDEVRARMVEEAEATKRTGLALMALVKECGRSHVRFEDVVERILGGNLKTASLAMTAFSQDIPTEAGPDALRILASVHNPEVRRELAVMTDDTEREATLRKVEPPKMVPKPKAVDPVEYKKHLLEAKVVRLEKALEQTKEQLENLMQDPSHADRVVVYQAIFNFEGSTHGR